MLTLYIKDLKQILDFEFCYRILKRMNIAIINKKLVKFRLHEKQATNLNRENNGADHQKLNKLYTKEYFWHLDRNTRIFIMEKNCKFFGYFMSLIRKLKNNS